MYTQYDRNKKIGCMNRKRGVNQVKSKKDYKRRKKNNNNNVKKMLV